MSVIKLILLDLLDSNILKINGLVTNTNFTI